MNTLDFVFIISVENGPCYGKSICTSNDFHAYIGSSPNRAQCFDVAANVARDIFASDAIITDMVFHPTKSNVLVTSSRDKMVGTMLLIP